MRPYKAAIVAWFQRRCRACARACGYRGPDRCDPAAVRYERAYRKLLRACGAEEASSECFVGFTYLYGRGHRDALLGAKWFTMGARRGDRACQWFLGELYANGEGVPADAVQAYVWTAFAGQAGLQPAAREAVALKRLLTPGQLLAAESLLGGTYPVSPRLACACA